MATYSILVTVNPRYIDPLCVMFASLRNVHPADRFDVYCLHKSLTEPHFETMRNAVPSPLWRFASILVDDRMFAHAPTSKRYPLEIYYRLFASELLPSTLDRVLYLDPDIVCLHSIAGLYDLPFRDSLFIGATHAFPVLQKFNEIRLNMMPGTPYLNTGVLLMNLNGLRKEVNAESVVTYLDKHRFKLMLPDQDILAGLFGGRLREVDALTYNLSDRYLRQYNHKTPLKIDLEWVRNNTVFVHYCGRNKPWRKGYAGILSPLYQEAKRTIQTEERT
jgi:lipopolysaccharide biosynthesis glycosyltransferase